MDIRSMQQHNLTERGREKFNKFSDLNHNYHHEYCTKIPSLWFIYGPFTLVCVCITSKGRGKKSDHLKWTCCSTQKDLHVQGMVGRLGHTYTLDHSLTLTQRHASGMQRSCNFFFLRCTHKGN